MKKKFTNLEIWETYNLVEQIFKDEERLDLPIKVNYALQLNRKTLRDKYRIIEEMRMEIGKKYGEATEYGFHISKEFKEKAQEEMNQLLEIEQMLDIMLISLEDLQNIILSVNQMAALIFMIEREE